MASDLKMHMRTHSGEEPYHCKQCEFSCVKANNLRQHMLSHSEKKPLHGSGQGAGNSGTEWNFLSISILSQMEQATGGCTLVSPTGTKLKKNMLGFVDDTRKFNNQNNNGNIVDENIQYDLEKWKQVSSIS